MLSKDSLIKFLAGLLIFLAGIIVDQSIVGRQLSSHETEAGHPVIMEQVGHLQAEMDVLKTIPTDLAALSAKVDILLTRSDP